MIMIINLYKNSSYKLAMYLVILDSKKHYPMATPFINVDLSLFTKFIA